MKTIAELETKHATEVAKLQIIDLDLDNMIDTGMNEQMPEVYAARKKQYRAQFRKVQDMRHELRQAQDTAAGSVDMSETVELIDDEAGDETIGSYPRDVLEANAEGHDLTADQTAAYLEWARDTGGHEVDFDGLPDMTVFFDNYRGRYDRFVDYAREYVDQTGLFEGLADDSDLVRYFDYDSYASDLQYDYSTYDAPGGDVFIFHNT